MRIRLFLLALLIALIGCGPKESDYPPAFVKLMNEYEQAAVKMAQEPEPDLKRMSRAERLAFVVGSIRKSARMHREVEAKAKQLNPPEKYRKVNSLLVHFMGEQARGEEEWANLVEARRPEGKAMAEKLNQASLDNLRPLIAEIQRVEPNAGHLTDSLRNLERQMAET